MAEADPRPTPAAPRRRPAWQRLLSFLVRAPIGCFSFLLGLVLVLVGMVPFLLNRSGPDWLEGAFADHFQGELTVERIDLGWFGAHRWIELELAESRSGEVGSLVLEAPGWMDLIRRGGTRFGTVQVAGSLHLVREADGSWNLARAFAPERAADGAEREDEGVILDTGDDADRGRLLGGLHGQVRLVLEQLTVLDHLGGGAPLTVAPFTAELTFVRGGPARLEGRGEIVGAPAGSLTFRADLGLPGAWHLRSGPLPLERLELELRGAPVALVDGLASTGGQLREWLGEWADVTVELQSSEDGARLDGSATLRSEHTALDLPLVVAGGRLSLSAGRSLRVEVAPEAPLALVAAHLPPDVEWQPGPQPWTLSLDTLSLPFDLRHPERLRSAATAGGTTVAGRLELGDLGLRAGERTLALRGLSVDLGVAAGTRPSLSGSAAVGGSGEQAGALEFGAVAAPLAELVTAAAAGEPLEAKLSLTLTELPTAVADALLEAQGLLVDLLGPAVSCELSARPGAAQPSAWLELQASSDVAQLDCAMELREGVLVPSADRPLDLHFELTPLSSPRVVGPLVPLLAEVRSVAGEGRAALRLEDFQLPLDGDLQRLSGRLVLDLGVVQATWVPGLEWLAGRSVGRLGPYEFTLAEGLAHYDHFRLTIDGRAVPLTGQVNLLDRTLSLGAELPLGAIGGEAGELLRAAREVLDPATAVPVRLSGSWPAVELDVDTEGVLAAARGALEGRISEELEEWTGGARDSVEQAAKELLERGLRDLFGRRKDG